MLEELREASGLGGPAAALANELLVIRTQYENGELNEEEYTFLLQQVAEVRAAQELATDEAAVRFIVAAATSLASMV